MAAKKAAKKKKNPRYLGMTTRRNPPGLAKRRNSLYAYQISVIQPGEGVRPLGGFPAKSRTDALKMAERELRKKGQWSARTKLLTAAVPLNSTAARHKNKTVIKAGRIDHLDVSKVHNGRQQNPVNIPVIVKYARTVAHSSPVRAAARLNKAADQLELIDQKILQSNLSVMTPQLERLFDKSERLGKALLKAAEKQDTANILGETFSTPAIKRLSKKRNAEHRDAKHPIHVRQYWQGRKGYKTPWQRAHEAGQGQLFKVKNRGTKSNPTLPSVKLPAPTSFKTLADAKRQRAAIARVEAQVNRAGDALLKAFRAVDAEITKAWKGGQPSPALRAKYKTAEARSSRAQSLKGRLNIYLESLDRHIANLKLQTKTRNPRRNSGAAESNRRDFAGTFSGYKELYFPEGTPKEGLSTLGPLVLIRTESGDIKPAGGTAVLCQDEAGKLYIGAKQNAPLIDGGARSFGKVRRVEYVCSKPHLGYPGRITWFHDFEDPLPTLKSDGRGGLHFHGGGYTIRREGITG